MKKFINRVGENISEMWVDSTLVVSEIGKITPDYEVRIWEKFAKNKVSLILVEMLKTSLLTIKLGNKTQPPLLEGNDDLRVV